MRSQSVLFLLLITHSVSAQTQTVITGTGPYNGPPGFDRGMQTTQHCGNDPESWVRASATLDKSSGKISITAQLETDSTTAGPKGRIVATARDAAGRALAEGVSDEIGIGGKRPGKAAIRNFSSTAQIPVELAAKATSLTLQAQCTGRVSRLWNIKSGNIFETAMKLFGG
jgi:hypothetical protein